jgi:hypothetical protein
MKLEYGTDTNVATIDESLKTYVLGVVFINSEI